ncbi:MAG: hypothetical protein FRX48_09273 [Lasallia pustulata]|uniref:Uncharacterized protein n=1 Tax=Lasallia pustulata TaxID=136370 RepID=A0A5M8PCL9_9LECA|nr:MAG: hypothetical protein FRX48_09273 [Lasallia pustulata]
MAPPKNVVARAQAYAISAGDWEARLVGYPSEAVVGYPSEALVGAGAVFPEEDTLSVGLLTQLCTPARAKWYLLKTGDDELLRLRCGSGAKLGKQLNRPGPFRQGMVEAVLVALWGEEAVTPCEKPRSVLSGPFTDCLVVSDTVDQHVQACANCLFSSKEKEGPGHPAFVDSSPHEVGRRTVAASGAREAPSAPPRGGS